MNRRFYTNFYKLSTLVCLLLFCSISLYAQPDLIVVESALQNSLQVQTLNSNDQCYLNEGCVNGLGQRDIIRFTTHIRNIGDTDFYVGAPPGNPANENEQWEYDECHGHWHYEGYAEYKLFDESNTEIPIGYKNGFCLIDVECNGGGTFTYTCSNQGISAGCGDIYSSGLACQWIDITDVADGRYSLEIRVNWDQSPDANGNVESSYANNTGSVCFDLARVNGQVEVDVVGNGCNPNTNCSEVTLTLNLDNYPEETSWEIRNNNNVAVATGGTYGNQPDGSTVTQVICLEDGCYDFIINDSYGDGICCGYGNGSYQLNDDSGNTLASGGQFTNSESTDFCVSSTPPPCTDNDNDGICAADDCDDNNNMVPAPPGAGCDDGDPNTDHDEIGEDGCTCAGVPIGQHNDCDDITIAANGSYIVINGIDVFPHVNIQVFNSNWNLVDACVDDCGTTYGYGPTADGVYYISVKTFDEAWQYECDILVDLTVGGGGGCPDNDNDGVCAADDCDDNNASLPAAVGSSCNDGDANTSNDQIQADGCTCEGTPNTGCTDNDNDGYCEDDDCDDNNSSIPAAVGSSCDDGNASTNNDQIQSDGCTCAGTPISGGGTCDDINISTSPSTISISGLDFPHVNIQVFTSAWGGYYSCVDNCGNPMTLNNVPAGDYIVSVKTFDEAWQYECDILETVTVGGGGGCTDEDNDGVCVENDCDDSNPNIPAAPGTTCNDGDAGTNNDEIQGDGCTCMGTPIGQGCSLNYTTGSGSITISGLNTAHVNLKLFDGTFNTVFACIDDCNNPQVIDGLPGGTYYIDVQLFDASWQPVCSISEYVQITNAQGFMANEEVEYLYFTAIKAHDKVNLRWVTNTDYRNSHFLIERSVDGISFTSIGQIASQLLEHNPSNYQRQDLNPFEEINFYRIKEVFADGTYRYSATREIDMGIALKNYNVYPNPTAGSVTIDLMNFTGKEASIILTNNLGQIVHRRDFVRLAKEPIRLDYKNIPAGVYFLFISVEGKKPIGEKLIISRL